jgi:hypothetical protein
MGPSHFVGCSPCYATGVGRSSSTSTTPYTNGFFEGKNNRIKVVKRLAYGYRSANNFRERILLSNRREACRKAA